MIARPWYNKQTQIQIDRENLAREKSILEQQKQQQHWDANRATAY
jgi:hypothetical protein